MWQARFAGVWLALFAIACVPGCPMPFSKSSHPMYWFTDDDLAERVREDPGMERLDLRGYQLITNEGMAHLKNLVHLKELDLRDTKISDKGLTYLQEVPHLELLRLGGEEDSDFRDVDVIIKRPRERCCAITDAGLAHLAQIPSLKRLELFGADLITEHGVSSFMKQRPDCEVSWVPARSGGGAKD